MAAALAERHGMTYYDWNDHFPRFKKAATDEEQPFLSKSFNGVEEYFGQPIPEYVEYLERQTEEAFQMVVADLLEMPSEGPIVTETIHIVELVLPIADYNRLVFLYVHEELFRKENWDRNDKERQSILGAIRKTSDPEHYMNHVTEVGVASGKRMIARAERSNIAMFERTTDSTVDGMLAALERHFGLG